MASANAEREPASPRPISALPSVQARILAFAAILIAGISGGLIGYAAVKVGCQGPRTSAAVTTTAKGCATPEDVGGLAGAVIAATGVAVIAVLVLRAMGEWRTIKATRQLEEVIAAAGAVPGRAPPAPDLGSGDTEAPGEAAVEDPG